MKHNRVVMEILILMAIIRKMDSVMNMKNDGQPFLKELKRFCDRDSGRS